MRVIQTTFCRNTRDNEERRKEQSWKIITDITLISCLEANISFQLKMDFAKQHRRGQHFYRTSLQTSAFYLLIVCCLNIGYQTEN